MKKREVSIYEDMSGPELEVSEFLGKAGLYWLYEQPVFIQDDKERPRVWTPDFYLPGLGIYIEVCGAPRDRDYKWRKNIYEINHIPIIFVQTYKGAIKWKPYLLAMIQDIHFLRSNKIDFIVHKFKFKPTITSSPK